MIVEKMAEEVGMYTRSVPPKAETSWMGGRSVLKPNS
jgi:hypothetical protein